MDLRQAVRGRRSCRGRRRQTATLAGRESRPATLVSLGGLHNAVRHGSRAPKVPAI